MVFIEGNWENPMDLEDVIQLVRNYYNENLADELEKYIPKHSNKEYEDLYDKYLGTRDDCADFENECGLLQTEIGNLELKNEKLEDKIEELLEEINDLKEQIFDMESDY